MDVVERLSTDEVGGPTLIALTHRHRYELAAELCAGLRVLDLCCGSGYGTEILAARSESVRGVDRHRESIELAAARSGPEGPASFECADALEVLGRELRADYDAIVMFEALEHLSDLDRITAMLRRHAEEGVMIVLSLPNSRPFRERNEHHVTEFEEETARATFASIGEAVVLRQWHAEGSLIKAVDEGPLNAASRLAPGAEPEHCNHFIAVLNGPPRALDAISAQMRLVVESVSNTYMLDLERANRRLWQTNQQLARERIGKADSAAAALLARLPPDPDEGAQESPRFESLRRFGRRTRTLLALLVPHGVMVLLAKRRELKASTAED